MIHKSVTTLFNSIIQTQKNGKSTKLFPFQRKVTLHLSKTTVLYFFLVLERLICDKIINFIKLKLTSHQFGFLKHRSCLTQLLSSHSEVVDSLNSGENCSIIYLELAKAFDKVPHNELLYKLWTMGIIGKWFRNYLSQRSHFVQFDSSSSDTLPVLSCVPQGSILGPLLFIIYINDMPTAITSSSIYIFADDTKLVKRTCVLADYSSIQTDLDNILIWCNKWNLS